LLTYLGVQRRQIDRLGCLATVKNLRRSAQQLVADLMGMQFVLLAELGHSFVFA
jgi:hypothetical protein